MLRPARRERPLSFYQLLNAMDRAEVHVTHAYLQQGLSKDTEHLLLLALREMRRVLARAGRRPEHLRSR